MQNLLNVLSFIWHHPLNRRRRLAALGRFVRWQVASRLFPGALGLPYVGGTMLLARSGMTGATGNYYCGLAEYEEMAFALHVLRSTDLFVDVGANIGSYSVLAGSMTGAEVIAVEPVPQTFHWLRLNIDFNNLGSTVHTYNVGLAAQAGVLLFSSDQDTMNRVLCADAMAGENRAVRIKVMTLDEACARRTPTLIKIDVEGYEHAVLTGGRHTLTASGLLAVVMETNDCGKRYGVERADLMAIMSEHGFAPCRYNPETRVLYDWAMNKEGNTLFVRDRESVKRRLETAARVSINGHVI